MKKILETKRCYIREFVEGDVELIYQMNSDPEVMKYITDGKPQTYEYSKKRTLYFINEYYSKYPGLGMWAVVRKAGDQLMGWVCLKHLDNQDLIEIGYRLIKEHWGQGYATEVSQALVHYGFTEVSLDKIVGIASEDNVKSQYILQKIGLTFLKKAYYYETNVVFYQLLKKDYLI
ncbi:GNAT family N-acetyltransferase [uncultured Microscilla sp.]|uniref:GNAT family N-acetyltransferase n=1 Tax=uncultured Microscilla sp. TaxID=432653 RepID=UPI00262EBFC5|nr:GNAT family N-acetyltransferase [uncultured Microscilla sp.]